MLLNSRLFISFLSIIVLHQTESVRAIKVVKTSDWNPPAVERRGRVEVVGVDLSLHQDLTVCVRVRTSQFGSSANNYHGIISAKTLRIFGSYSTIIRKPFI